MKVNEIITQKIIDQLEKGEVPWHKPWTSQGMPKNLISKKEYRGINIFMLAHQHYSSPYWLTYKQAQELGGNVKQGKKGTPVIFWKWLKVKEDEEEKQIPMLRYYTVFNVTQCEGIDESKIPQLQKHEFTPIEACEMIDQGYKDAPIKEISDHAYFKPATDTIGMPPKEEFEVSEEYYSTLFHEITHSTGHYTRLDRVGIRDMCSFGSTNYSQEELVAEMGAAFLCGYAGIENKTVDNSVSYIQSWLKKLRNDKKCVIIAAAQAQKAFDLILNKKIETES